MARLDAAAIKYPVGTDRSDFISPMQSEFLDWLTDPQKEGSQNTWAKEHKIPATALTAWKKEKFFREEWDKRATKLFGGPDRVQALMEALYQAGLGGDVKAINTYLQVIEKHTPKRIVQNEGSADDMSDDELAAALERSVTRLRSVK